MTFCSTSSLAGADFTATPEVNVLPWPGKSPAATHILFRLLDMDLSGSVEGCTYGDIIRQLRGNVPETSHRRPLGGALHWLQGTGWLRFEVEYGEHGKVVWRRYSLTSAAMAALT